jgi:hypothetical protein
MTCRFRERWIPLDSALLLKAALRRWGFLEVLPLAFQIGEAEDVVRVVSFSHMVSSVP